MVKNDGGKIRSCRGCVREGGDKFEQACVVRHVSTVEVYIYIVVLASWCYTKISSSQGHNF